MSKMKKKKTFGDTTSFTIPANGKFTDIKTNKERNVTPEMLYLVNEHIDRRTLGHAIMSFLYWQAHGSDTQPKYERLEVKIDEVLEILKGEAVVQSTSTESNYPDDTDELLNEHFG